MPYDPKVHIPPPMCLFIREAQREIILCAPGIDINLQDLFNDDYCKEMSVDENLLDWRDIICAVARCGWLDARDEILKDRPEENKRLHQMQKNAAAWKALAKETFL